MIENPHDLFTIRVALQVAIECTANADAIPRYEELLRKVERLEDLWRTDGRRRRHQRARARRA